jgi:hypothetical protein
MHTRSGLVVLLALALLTPRLARAGFAEGDNCVVKARLLLVPKAGKKKNIPLKPGVTLQIVGIAKQRLEVQTEDGEEGFINRVKIEKDCELVAPPAKPAAPTPAPEPTPAATPTPALAPAPVPAPPPPPPVAPPPPPATPPESKPALAPTPATGTETKATEPTAVAATGESAPQPEVVTATAPTTPPPEPVAAQTESAPAFPPPTAPATTVQVGAVLRGTTASSELGMLVGARGAWVRNGRLSLGAAGFVTVIDPLFADATYRNDRYLRFFYLGAEAGYAVTLPDPVGMRVRALLGGGGVSHHSMHSTDVGSGTQGFFVVEPGVELYGALLPRLTLSAGVGYRFTRGSDFSFDLRRAPPKWPLATESSALLDGFNFEITGAFDLL